LSQCVINEVFVLFSPSGPPISRDPAGANSGRALIGKTRVFFPAQTRLGRSAKPSVSRQIFRTRISVDSAINERMLIVSLFYVAFLGEEGGPDGAASRSLNLNSEKLK